MSDATPATPSLPLTTGQPSPARAARRASTAAARRLGNAGITPWGRMLIAQAGAEAFREAIGVPPWVVRPHRG